MSTITTFMLIAIGLALVCAVGAIANAIDVTNRKWLTIGVDGDGI